INTGTTVASISAPVWLRMVKTGTTLKAYYKTTLAGAWTNVNSFTMASTGANSQIALFESSHSTTTTGLAVFDDFQASAAAISTTDDNLSFNGTAVTVSD